MTRRDSEVGDNDADEIDRGASSSEKVVRGELVTRTSSHLLSEKSKPTPVRQRLVHRESKDERKKEEDHVPATDVVTEAAGSHESIRPQQHFRRKMDGCFAQMIEAAGVSSTITSGPQSTGIFASASGSSTPAGETRLSTSILFELPEPCTSTSQSMEKMPAITKAQMKEFEEAFNLFDKDRDGSITKEELGRVMRGLGQFARTEELRTMLEEIDTDGDGNVSLVEFVKIVSNIGSANAAAATDLSQEEQEEQELRDAFRVFDKHNRGYITASDLRAVLQCLGEDLSEEEIEDMIKEVDEDGDGRIDFYEFARSLVDPGTDDEDEDEEDDEQPLP